MGITFSEKMLKNSGRREHLPNKPFKLSATSVQNKMILKIHMRHLYVVKRSNNFGNLIRDKKRKERGTFLSTARL